MDKIQKETMEKTHENLRMYGVGKWEVKDEHGNIIKTGEARNQIKTVGKQEVAKLVGYGLAGTVFRYLALGTSSTANDPAQQTLVAEITDTGLERAAATITNPTTTTTGDTSRFVKLWTATGAKTIEEVAIFNATPAGVMLGRLLTGTITLANGNTFQFTYDIVFA